MSHKKQTTTETLESQNGNLENVKCKVIDAWEKGELCTDSDILDMSEELGVPAKEISHIIAVERSRGTACERCKHIDGRYYYSPMPPCDKCSRIQPVSDMYEAE